MADDWVQRRFNRYQERLAAEKRKLQSEQNAQASYDAFFDRLKKRVEEDVATYNHLFTDQECHADFKATRDGFTVTRGDRARRNSPVLSVTKNGGAVIGIKMEVVDVIPSFDSMEIAPDENGEVCYKHAKRFLRDECEASEAILNRLLCS